MNESTNMFNNTKKQPTDQNKGWAFMYLDQENKKEQSKTIFDGLDSEFCKKLDFIIEKTREGVIFKDRQDKREHPVTLQKKMNKANQFYRSHVNAARKLQ